MNGYLWHKGRANWKKRADREEEPKRPDPKPSELRMDRKTRKEDRTADCCRSPGRAVCRSGRLIKLGNSWINAKSIRVQGEGMGRKVSGEEEG